MTIHPTLILLMPETLLSITAVLALFFGRASFGMGRDRAPWISIFGLAAAASVATWSHFNGSAAQGAGGVSCDALSYFVRMAVCCVGALAVLVNWHIPHDDERPEYFCLMLFALAGASLAACADDLLLLFLSLELVSVPTYVLIALSRSKPESQEATVKYFFLGAFAAAITLYGFSFLYGVGGTTTLRGSGSGPSLAIALAAAPAGSLVGVGLLLSLCGLAFKVAAVPLHFYVADVYQGAASPVSGLLGFLPKMAGFVAMIRLLDLTGWRIEGKLFWLLWVVAAATMLVGNTLALMQRDNVKRVLAYSSIAHSGYMLVALLAGPGNALVVAMESPLRNGVAALLFYMVIYGVMNLGAFAALAYFRSRAAEHEPIETFMELTEAARSRPWAAGCLAVCALGLMGLPPTAGMWGKLMLFTSALSLPNGHPYGQAMIYLVVLGVINAAIGAVYYLRIAAACVTGPLLPDAAAPTRCGRLRLGLILCTLLVLIAFVRPGPLITQAHAAADEFRARAAVAAGSVEHAGQQASR